MACDFIDFNNSKWTAKTLENPCFGTSRRLNGISLGAALKNKLKSRQQLFAELERRQRFARRLEKHAVAKHPLEVDKQDYVEAAVFAGQTYSEVFATKIAFGSDEGAPAEKLTEQNMLDDLGNDYMDFSTYLMTKFAFLQATHKEVELLLEQDHAKISGRCVELGSAMDTSLLSLQSQRAFLKLLASIYLLPKYIILARTCGTSLSQIGISYHL